MSPTLSLRRRRPELDVPPDEVIEDPPPIASAKEQVASKLGAKVTTIALMGCLVAGPLGLAAGGLAIAQASGSVAPVQTTVPDQSNERAAAGEFAQRLVLAWLGSTRDHPEQLAALVSSAQTASLPTVAFTTSDPAVSSIRSINGVWAVTVAVTVTDSRPSTARRFFQVPVVVTDQTLAALTLPSPVAGPPVAAGADLDYQVQVASTGPVASTVAQFLSAYLAGAGDVTRYVTPGDQLPAIDPAPYTAVRVTDLRCDLNVDTAATPKDGTILRLLAAADATATAKQTVSVNYALTLRSRAGRWEVAAIDPSPALSTKSPGAGPASGQPTPTGSITTPTGPTSSATTP
ncbi:MAG: conjugal transfer protein [Intrasporangium sp.]|uniref:conjugal transfer protein n=1 Tax=Intrasporangium sp. TaxID=1925024 RepID=UPI002649FD61|nr:conjugal transfer protein [Intrasporangium sp.]MDN5798170.1 conjugal transfer protein [Intrasporangium sp.]